MIHQIKLSNGQILQVEEGENCIHIAAMHEGEVDAYICEINPNGTLVMPNSGPAGEYLTNGLKLSDESNDILFLRSSADLGLIVEE